MRMWIGLAAVAPLIAAGVGSVNTLTDEERKSGYVLLFNGRDLTGWSGNPRVWKVEDGMIVGASDDYPIQLNTFLVYEKPFSDFHLSAEVRLRNGNSGLHFRSTHIPGPGWIVMGYQADFSDAGDRSAWGNFYEERGRSRTMMKTPDEGWQVARKHVRPKDWNRIEVRAEGSRIRIWLNGVQTIDARDDKAASGIIALQLHSGEPMRVEFRNLKLKPPSGKEASAK
ncbi:MAG: DUF1080 domain-containing protein [Bryobacteraceae bacterium]